jgi:hypothetical protein
VVSICSTARHHTPPKPRRPRLPPSLGGTVCMALPDQRHFIFATFGWEKTLGLLRRRRQPNAETSRLGKVCDFSMNRKTHACASLRIIQGTQIPIGCMVFRCWTINIGDASFAMPSTPPRTTPLLPIIAFCSLYNCLRSEFHSILLHSDNKLSPAARADIYCGGQCRYRLKPAHRKPTRFSIYCASNQIGPCTTDQVQTYPCSQIYKSRS